MNTTVSGFNIQPDSFNDLIENKYYNDFVDELQEQDRAEFIQHLLFAKKRTFKNFIDNNSNLLRKQRQTLKSDVNKEVENLELRLHNYSNNQMDILQRKPGAMNVAANLKKKEAYSKHRPLSMSLGLQNNTISTNTDTIMKPNTRVGFYVSNTKEIDRQNIEKFFRKADLKQSVFSVRASSRGTNKTLKILNNTHKKY